MSDHDYQCPCCPIEVRDLLATLHNYLGELDHTRANPDVGVRRLARKEAAMRQSYARLQGIADDHFADHKDHPSCSKRWERLVAGEATHDA